MVRYALLTLLSATMACASSVLSVSDAVECRPIAVFDEPAAADTWRAVNDNVMGGRSSGGPRNGNGELIFSGSINTDGGGFSSIRAPLEQGSLAGMNGLKLRVRTDGRAYSVTLRSSVRYRGVAVAFRAPIALPGEQESAEGGWTEGIVRFDELVSTVFGRRVEGASFDPADARSIGIIINDGIDGPFEFALRSIHACAL